MKCWCGYEMISIGKGKYPYDCIAKDKNPNAEIIICPIHKGWAIKENETKEGGSYYE